MLVVATTLLALLVGCAAEEQPPAFSLLLGGDTDFGESYHHAVQARNGNSVLDDGDYDRPLAALAPLLRGSDLVLLNLETPLTAGGLSPLTGTKSYIHWSDPEKAPESLHRHNVTAVSLANNHSMDYGTAGLIETLAALRDRQIASLGAGTTNVEARRPWVREVTLGTRTFRFAVFAGFEYRTTYDEGHRFYADDTMAGVNPLTPDAMADEIARFRAENPETFIIVFPHWGDSYGHVGPHEQAISHRLVDAGADLIVGHGTHTIQPIERHRGRWILYGIGNFAFGAPGRYEKFGAPPFGLAVRFELREGSQGLARSLRLYPLLTNNSQTRYRSRPVTRKEFAVAHDVLRKASAGREELEEEDMIGRDRFGWHLKLSAE